MKTTHWLLLIIALPVFSCGGGQDQATTALPEKEWDKQELLSNRTVHYDLGDTMLTIDVPIEWEVVSQSSSMLMMRSSEQEMISMSVMSKEGSTLDEVCPVFWKKMDSSLEPIGAEQPVKAPGVVGRQREFEGDVPSMGGPVHMIFYCLHSGRNYLKLDVVANKEVYYQKPGLYASILERFRFTTKNQ